MDCNVVRDLIPLYIDECCCEESADIVKKHIDSCSQCKALYESMNSTAETKFTSEPIKKISRIDSWKASVLQSVLLFASFFIITVGVALEAGTPSGFDNGYWAFSLVVPATGFLLSLANWYFVRFYKSRKSFTTSSVLITIVITVAACLWTGVHYELSIMDFAELLKGISIIDLIEMTVPFTWLFGVGVLLTAMFCILSKFLSDKYAKMLGKE